jgi:hypothetical protein
MHNHNGCCFQAASATPGHGALLLRWRVPFFVQALRNAAFPQMLSFKNNNWNASLNVHTKTFPYRLFL